MKKYTEKEIMNALVENQSFESDGAGNFYYIHVGEDGELLPSLAGAEMSFNAEYKGECLEDYDHESEENAEFMEVVESLAKQVNEHLKTL